VIFGRNMAVFLRKPLQVAKIHSRMTRVAGSRKQKRIRYVRAFKMATIKHKKGATDAKRGRVFTRIIREISIAARIGGGERTRTLGCERPS